VIVLAGNDDRGQQRQECQPSLANFLSRIEHEIPEGRQNLADSHSNLEKVARLLAKANYFQVGFAVNRLRLTNREWISD